MWYGTLGDASLLSDQELMANARQWLGADRIVIGHANYPTVTRHYGELIDIIRTRNLQMVTLNDVYS
jgi:hypothetical protein